MSLQCEGVHSYGAQRSCITGVSVCHMEVGEEVMDLLVALKRLRVLQRVPCAPQFRGEQSMHCLHSPHERDTVAVAACTGDTVGAQHLANAVGVGCAACVSVSVSSEPAREEQLEQNNMLMALPLAGLGCFLLAATTQKNPGPKKGPSQRRQRGCAAMLAHHTGICCGNSNAARRSD